VAINVETEILIARAAALDLVWEMVFNGCI